MSTDFWIDIDALAPDKEPLTDEEKEQIRGGDEFVSLEDAKHELEL